MCWLFLSQVVPTSCSKDQRRACQFLNVCLSLGVCGMNGLFMVFVDCEKHKEHKLTRPLMISNSTDHGSALSDLIYGEGSSESKEQKLLQ